MGGTEHGSGLFDQHREMLDASAVPADFARQRGYKSVDTKAMLQSLGFSPQQRRTPGLLIPLHDRTGKCVGFQYRPDTPRETPAGRVIKYETPPEQKNRLDVPPGVGQHLDDPNVPLWITEGSKKADAAAVLGLACVSLSGVWNWRGTGPKDGKTAIPDWHDVALNGRRVVLAFDSDSRTNDKVAAALNALGAYLRSKGADVVFCQLPDGGDGKTGLDDYIAAGHGVDDLNKLLVGMAEPEPPAARDNASTSLVYLALDRYRVGISAEDEVFALPHDGPQVVRPLRGGKNSLRAALADAYFTAYGSVAPQQALTEALLTLEGKAAQQDAERLYLRVAAHDGRHYLDLGDPTGRAVQIDGSGWQVIDSPPVLFRRTQLTGALPVPERGADLADLWTLLNVAERDRPLVLAWLVAAFLPDVPHPVLTLRGEQGSGKSTGTRTLAGLLDPSPAQVRKPPRDVDGWVMAASGSWVVGVDNVSTVNEWWSDALCRAVTGDGDVRRRLYSDADLTVFSFRRVVLLNGIDLGAVRDDLAERLLTVELQRIGERGRRLDADLAELWAQAHPRLLGALLDLTVRVLAALPGLQLERLPRMADFARILAAVDVVLGTTGLATYTSQAGDLAADAVSGDPVLAAITSTITQPWDGTAVELLALIDGDTEQRRPKEWPKDARSLTALLRRRAPSLRRLGWTVEDLGRGGKAKAVRFSVAPPPQDGGRQAGDSAPEAGDAGDRRATGNDDARQPATLWPAETAFDGPEAGDAGDKTRTSLTEASRTTTESPGNPVVGDDDKAMREGTETSPATPADADHCVICDQKLLLHVPGRDTCAKCRLTFAGVAS